MILLIVAPPTSLTPPLSGPCMTLVVTKGETGEGVVGDIRQLIGPPDVEKAKQEAPDRWVRTVNKQTHKQTNKASKLTCKITDSIIHLVGNHSEMAFVQS